jgi:serine/threonine-protein kinase
VPTPVDLQLGRLAVQRGLTTEERVRECLELQRRNRAIGYDEPLSAVLAKRGFIGEPERRTLEDELALFQFLRGEQLFARRCVERGLLDREAARALLAELRAGGHGTRVGDLLVERGTIDRATRDAIAREVFSFQDEEERAAREADARAVAGAPAPPPPGLDEGAAELPAGQNVQPRALASFGRDQRRFSSSGEWVEGALPRVEGFEVEQRLGQGPNGVVYRARVVATNERVALKVLSPALVGSPGFVAAIKRAWALAQRVDHQAFVRLGAPGRTSELIFYTMDLIDGDSLRATVERSGPLASERVVALLRPLLAGLERAHQVGAVHGALSPDNVLIARATGWPVITDLPLSGVGLVGQGAAGLYASPQRLTGATQPTPADDLYSLACVAYFAALGKPPFADANPTLRLASGVADPREADPGLDSRLATFIERCCRPEPGDRLDVAQANALFEAPRAPRPPQPPQPPQVPRAPTRPVPPRPDALPPPSGDNDRTLFMPAVLPLPASAGAAQAAAAAARVDEGIERTMELAPPPGLLVAPVEEEEARLDQTIVTPPPTAQDEPIERTIVMTAPPSYPPADTGQHEIDRTIAVGPPTGWSDLLRKAPISSSNSSTQPLTAATVPPSGVLASTLEDSALPPLAPPPPPANERGPQSSAFVRPTARQGDQPGARQAAAAAIAENDPHFNAMGETMPMRPLGASQDDLTGRLIHNRYRIVGKLGQGGMGIVYKAEHTLMGRTVAFKVLNPELVKNTESIARFKREVMAMAQFQHRNVVRIFDAGATEDGRFYMAMELVDGVSLCDVLKQGPMPLDRFVRTMAQILRGVAEGHKRGIVHRDLKAENILLTSENGEEIVKIMDFGIAKVLWAQESPQSQSNAFLTTERMAVGTPEYMSPEQASGGAKIDARSDIYSLGVVGYEMVTGRLPFDADSPVGFIGKHIVDPPITFAERAPHLHLPPSLEQMIMRALEKDPESRFPSAEAMLVGLEQALPEHAGALRAVAGGDARGSRSAAPSPYPTTPPTKVLGPPLGSGVERRGGPTGSAAAKGPGKTPLESSTLGSVEASAEISGEGTPSPGGGGVLVKRLLLALAAVATLLLVTIVVLVLVRRPSTGTPGGEAPVAGVLDADRQKRVDEALGQRKFDEARRLLEEVRPEDAADPARAPLDEQLKRVAAAEDASTKLSAAAAELPAAVEALRRVSAAEDLAQAEAALGKVRDLTAEGARLHAALTSLGLSGLAATPPGADVAALEAQLVAPLRELEDAVKIARGLLAATPPEYDSALGKLELALARTKLPARRDELEALRRQAKHDQLVALARRELDRQPPNFARAIDLLQQAHASAPSAATKDLLDRTAARAAEDSRGSAERQVGDLVRRAEEALSRGDVDVAERELERARRLQQDQRLQDTWDFPARLAAVKAEKASRAAHAALPAVTDQSTAAELEFALGRRRAYVQEHPEGYKRAEVEAECAAFEARLEALRGGSSRRSVDRLLASAREAFERRAWDEARSLVKEAAEAARGGGLDPGPATALGAQIDARELQVQALERDFVQVGPLRFCRYEVTVREYFAFCHRRMTRAKESGDPAAVERVRALWLADWTPTRDRPDVPSFPTGTSQNPAGGVSFRDAEEYCAWRSEELGLKVRLPTEAEWLQAATNGQAQSYPWGAAWDPARVAYRRMNDGPVSVVTSLEGQSPFDLRHMAGNVAEWVDTVWEDAADGPDPSSRMLKGGSFRSMAPENLTVTARVRGGVTERKSEWGFRVVVEVGP